MSFLRFAALLAPLVLLLDEVTPSSNFTSTTRELSQKKKGGFNRVFCPNFPLQSFNSDNVNFHKIIDIEPITPGFAILEGPVWVDDKLLLSHIGYSVDGTPGPADLMSYGPRGFQVEREGYGSNGLTLDLDGTIFAARHETGSIEELDSGRTVVGTFNGARFNSPNDLVVSSLGVIFFTDPDYQAGDNPTQTQERAYYVDAQKNVAAFGENEVDKPNGIYLSKNEDVVYVGGTNGLFVWELSAKGEPTRHCAPVRPDIIQGSVDGMSRDCAGNLYVTLDGKILVLSFGEHRLLGSFDLPGVTNVAFGGNDGRTLFATTLGERPAIWSARVEIRGLPF